MKLPKLNRKQWKDVNKAIMKVAKHEPIEDNEFSTRTLSGLFRETYGANLRDLVPQASDLAALRNYNPSPVVPSNDIVQAVAREYGVEVYRDAMTDALVYGQGQVLVTAEELLRAPNYSELLHGRLREASHRLNAQQQNIHSGAMQQHLAAQQQQQYQQHLQAQYRHMQQEQAIAQYNYNIQHQQSALQGQLQNVSQELDWLRGRR
jgi:hypothetical protein